MVKLPPENRSDKIIILHSYCPESATCRSVNSSSRNKLPLLLFSSSPLGENQTISVAGRRDSGIPTAVQLVLKPLPTNAFVAAEFTITIFRSVGKGESRYERSKFYTKLRIHRDI